MLKLLKTLFRMFRKPELSDKFTLPPSMINDKGVVIAPEGVYEVLQGGQIVKVTVIVKPENKRAPWKNTSLETDKG